MPSQALMLLLGLALVLPPAEKAVVLAAGDLKEPFAIDWDKSGNAYIAEMGGNRISLLDKGGKLSVFAGTGEKLEDFEPFHPDRMASRILGMGDMLTLIEKAEAAYDVEERERAEAIVREGTFTLENFLEQMQQVKKMGPLQNVLGMMPGMPKELKNADIDERELAKVEAIIRSMTPYERRKPDVINGSRRTRIARGSGVRPSDVSALLKQFTRDTTKGFR